MEQRQLQAAQAMYNALEDFLCSGYEEVLLNCGVKCGASFEGAAEAQDLAIQAGLVER